MTQPAPALEARSVTKHFPVRQGGTRLLRRDSVVHAVDGVSLTVPDAGILAIVGESGCGKSTLARLLARVLQPTSGEVLVHGVPAGAGSRRDYARTVQMVLQDPFSSLNPVHTVRYHLSRPLALHGIPAGTDMDTAIEQLLDRVALSPAAEFAAKYPHELSGGQRQRVAIARALAVRPKVLIADEPVSMLDVSIRLGVLNLLAGLRDNERLAIAYITHDIASARYLADEVAVMYAGTILETGPATDVTDSPQHPYSQLLLAAAPDPDRAGSLSLQGRGAPPSLVSPPSGCRFHPRCPFAMDVCSRQAPPVVETGPGHRSACWLHAPQASSQIPTHHASTPASHAGTGQAGQAGEPDPGTDPAGRAAT
ncbi:MAG TPA: ABC transporter ATP-binding protein [Streptosporangiaceae bacterium]|nr:ABC transporter ATP-binding protein [Streptosporangiaceae bacterium]